MAVIQFPNGEKAPDGIPEDDKPGIEKCLELAAQRDLEEIFIIGRKGNGDVWFSTNNGDLGDMLFLIETAKHILIRESLDG